MFRSVALACFALVFVACGSGGSTAGATPSPVAVTPSAMPTPALTDADRAEAAQLAKRPLMIPAPAADGSCDQGPFTPSISPYANGVPVGDVYGAGPVFGQGGPAIQAAGNVYFDVTYFVSPGVHGVVLVRINDVSRKYEGRFVGSLGAGPSLGSDTIQGESVPVFAELALPADRPPVNNPAAAQGWGVWHIRQGIDARFTCAAIQIDTASGTEVILGH